MKIRVTETYIEADARELRESRTLSENFASLLSRAFAPTWQPDDEDETEEEAAE